jgi:ankyrin repeat protein
MKPKTLFDCNLTFEDAQELINNGANVNADNYGYAPLHLTDNPLVVQLLIDHGADVNATNPQLRTPIFSVTPLKMVDLLNESNRTSMEDFYKMQTFFSRYVEIIKILIENGADVNHIDIYDAQPINYITSGWLQNINILNLLIDHGADVNHACNRFYRPIHGLSNIEIAKVLIKNGAHLNVRSKTLHSTPLDLSFGDDVMELLISHGALPCVHYDRVRHKFPIEKQIMFDSFNIAASNHDEFFEMCLAYQNDHKNHIPIEISDLDFIDHETH